MTSEGHQYRDVESVSVVGGGDSGLLAALLVQKFNPGVDVRIIDDFSTPVPDVGKSTYIDILELLHDVLGIDERRFLARVKPIWKTSAYFKDWGGHDPFHLPFDDESIIPPEAGEERFETFYYRHENKAFRTLDAELTERRKTPLTEHDLDSKYDRIAYQLNTGRFNEFLRDVCNEREIELIDDPVTDVVVSGNEIERVESEQSTYFSDMYVDATGFDRLLMGHLDHEFLPFEFLLDSALVTKVEIPPTEIVPATVIESKPHGWTWQIDTFDYRDLGYVYSSAHASREDAMDEFLSLDKLMTRSDVQHYTFESGVCKEAWVGNCLVVGNAAGFVEPLTATAITMGANLSMKFSELLADHHQINHPGVREIYNSIFRAGWDNIRNYIALLYKHSSEDTEFWSEMNAVEAPMLDRQLREYHRNGFSSNFFFDGKTQDELFPFDQWDVYRLLRNLGVTSEFYNEIDITVSDDIRDEIRRRDRRLNDHAEDYLTYEEVSHMFEVDGRVPERGKTQ